MAANGTELPQQLERKRFCLFAVKEAGDVLGALPSLALCKLAGSWGGLACLGVEDERGIADGPNICAAAQTHIRLGEQPALFFGRTQALNDRRGRTTDGADDGAAFNGAPALQGYALPRGQGDAL